MFSGISHKLSIPTRLLLVVWYLNNMAACLAMADVNSGCPLWGCLPWGSFSLSAGIPAPTATVRWRVMMEQGPSTTTYSSRVPRSCVSNEQAVVCTSQSGYLSIDPTTGKQQWSYTTMSSPYLPIMDIYSDVIGMDVKAMYYIGAGGKPESPISVSRLMPAYSLMVANDSILFLTASTNNTAQCFTYNTDGVIDSSLALAGTVEGIHGTFLPCSQPIIAGFRTYVMTCFAPNEMGSKDSLNVPGIMRLYAIDLLHQIVNRTRVAWYFNVTEWNNPHHSNNHLQWNSSTEWSQTESFNPDDPVVTYFDGTVYVSVPGVPENVKQTRPGTMWAIRDDGNKGTLLFRTSCIYGPMAVYDTYSKPMKTGSSGGPGERHIIWSMNHSPAMIQGLDSLDGSRIPTTGLDVILQSLGSWITSRLTITRSPDAPGNDQLVFGMSDSSRQARVVVIEINTMGQAKLIFSSVVSNTSYSQSKDNTAYVEGQIVNFAFKPSTEMSKYASDKWTLGLAVMVSESNKTSTRRSVVGVF